MDMICRVCQQSEVDELIPISFTATTQQKRISEMLSAVTGSSVEENDRLPQHVCNKCFDRLDQTYALWKLSRSALRKELLHPKTETAYECLICCDTNDGEDLMTIASFSGKWKMLISDMIQHLSGALEKIHDLRSLSFVCKSCFMKMDSAYEFKSKCLQSGAYLFNKVSYPWENMEVDVNNPENLVVDLFTEAVQEQDVLGRVHCSVCQLGVEMQQLGKKCDGCLLEFRNYDEIRQNQVPSCAEESNKSCSVEMASVWLEENTSQDNEQDERHFEFDDDNAETDSEDVNDDSTEIMDPEYLEPEYDGSPEQFLDIIEEYPDNPFQKVQRKGPICCRCHTLFATKTDLLMHQSLYHKNPTGKGQFSCDDCRSLYATPLSLKVHRKTLETLVYDYCKSCQVVLHTPYLLEQHKKRFHTYGKTAEETQLDFTREIVVTYDCCVLRCPNRYSSEEDLLKHLNQAHNQAKQLTENSCQYCEVSFSSEYALLIHCNRKTERKQYRCLIDGCGYKRFFRSSMLLHCTQNPHRKMPMLYGRKNQMKTRLADMKHFSVIGEMDDNTDIVKRIGELCCRCLVVFGTKEELTAHCKLHSIEENKCHHCQTCGVGFDRLFMFSRHKNITENSFHYYCRVCKILFWRKFEYTCHKTSEHFPDDLNDLFETIVDHTFVCCGCREAFETEADLAEHRREKHPLRRAKPEQPKCDYCQMFVRSAQLLDTHIALSKSKTSYRCKVRGCVFRTTKQDNIRRHVIGLKHRDSSGTYFQPDPKEVSGCVPKYIELIRQHVLGSSHQTSDEATVKASNANSSDYSCCVFGCEFRCHNYDTLIEHGAAMHADKREHFSIQYSDRKYKCSVCAKGFDNQTTALNHKNVRQTHFCKVCRLMIPRNKRFTHSVHCAEKLKVTCEICNRLMASKDSLRMHVKLVHSKEIEKHVCSICGKEVRKINTHMQIHENKRDWVCKVCDARFNNKYVLRNHEQRIHMDERRHACRHGCEKRYKCSGDRDRHEKLVHLGIKPFGCDLCDDSFVRDRDLRLHRRKHTGLKLYPCSRCDASFNKKTEFEEHSKECVGIV